MKPTYITLRVTQNVLTIIGQPSNCHQAIKSFNPSIQVNCEFYKIIENKQKLIWLTDLKKSKSLWFGSKMIFILARFLWFWKTHQFESTWTWIWTFYCLMAIGGLTNFSLIIWRLPGVIGLIRWSLQLVFQTQV